MKRPAELKLRMASRLACIAFSILALSWIFRRIDLNSLGDVLRRAEPGWMIAAFAVFGAGFLLAAARWHLVLRLCRSHVHAGATVRTVLIGHLFNTILFGPAGGDVAKTAFYARSYGFPTASILASCMMDRFLGGIGFIVFAGLMPGFAAYGGHWGERLTRFIHSPRFAIAIGVTVVLTLAATLLRRRFDCWPILGRISRDFIENGRQFMRHPRFAARGVVFSVLSHLCISCVFLFLLKAITDTPFSMAAVFWIFPVISVITSAPLTFAGAGLREGAALYFLGLYGIPAEDAVAAALMVLVVYLVWAMVGGVLFWREDPARFVLRPNVPTSISVIIPTLNEAEALPETIARATQVPEISEIIVVDGGSSDATVEIAEQLGCRVLQAPRGRGSQLDGGARHARGDVVLLLHADTWLPPEAGQALMNCLRDDRVVAGGFWKVFDEKSLMMAGSRLRCALRLLLFQRIMGDQVIFVRRDALEAVGGIPHVPLMEDLELCRRLRKLGRLALAGATVTTSARRFAKHGVARTYWRMWNVTARYYLGAPAHDLREIYERD